MGICPLPSFSLLTTEGKRGKLARLSQSWGSLAPAELLGFCVTGLGDLCSGYDFTAVLISGLIKSYVQVVTVSYLCDGAPGSGV